MLQEVLSLLYRATLRGQNECDGFHLPWKSEVRSQNAVTLRITVFRLDGEKPAGNASCFVLTWTITKKATNM